MTIEYPVNPPFIYGVVDEADYTISHVSLDSAREAIVMFANQSDALSEVEMSRREY